MPELNVLVVGMPNVGKSTLLNALRNVGIQGRKSTPLGSDSTSDFHVHPSRLILFSHHLISGHVLPPTSYCIHLSTYTTRPSQSILTDTPHHDTDTDTDCPLSFTSLGPALSPQQLPKLCVPLRNRASLERSLRA